MSETVFVTGGSGFVGRAIVRALVARGYHVRALARSARSAEELAALGAEPVRGELGAASSLAKGCAGAGLVVHAAGSLTSALSWDEHARINVEGTRAVLDAARGAGAKRFLYLGAASVVIDGSRPAEGDEDALPPRVDRALPYSGTKALAEAMVLAADSPAMRTVSLRPPLIWGPGAAVLAVVADALRRRRFAYVDGGRHLYSVAHVDNVAEAVVCALRSEASGRAYFITDDEVGPMRELFTQLLSTRGVDASAPSVPHTVAILFGRLIATLFGWFAPRKRPPLTLEDVRLTGQTLHLSSARARAELGYRPVRSRADGLAALRAHETEQEGRGDAGHAAGRPPRPIGAAAIAIVAGMLGNTAYADAPGDDPSGLWQLYDDKTGKPNGVVRITIEDAKAVGRIERLRPGTTAQDKCAKCPPPQKDKPYLGLTVLWGMAKDGDHWSGGRILDPDEGDTYRCTMRLAGPNTLEVRGYLGISLFGRSQRWTRVP